MPIPSFLKKKGNSVLFDQDGEFLFYVPDCYFTDTKLPLAQINGQYLNMVGICDWALVSPTGKEKKKKRFYLPTLFTCKPDRIEKVNNFSINDKFKKMDYRIIHFKSGDEIISNVALPQDVANAELVFKTFFINSGKIPPTIPYDKIQDYIVDSLRLNGNDYGIGKQLFGVPISEIARSERDLSVPFRYTNMKDQYSYQQIGMGSVSKYVSPFVAFTGENYDESLMASIILSKEKEQEDEGSPLEKVLMG